MMSLWSVMGIALGVHAALELNGDAVFIVSFALAGMLVYATIGMALGLFCDRAKESIAGGFCGLGVGILTSNTDFAATGTNITSICVVVGAIVGATCWVFVRTITKLMDRCRKLARWATRNHGSDALLRSFQLSRRRSSAS